MNFGEKLFQLRTERGIYQKQLAEYLSVSIGTISNYENSVHYPDLETLCRFAEYFKVSTDYLLDLTGNAMPIDSLNAQLTDGYTVGGALNIILELSQPSRQRLGKYLVMLKTCEEMPQKEQTIRSQKQLIKHQKQVIERLNQTVDRQAEMILELREQLKGKKVEISSKVFSEATDI